MTAIKPADLPALLSRPAFRLLVIGGADDASARAFASQAIRALGDPTDPMAVTDLTPDQLRQDPGRLADEAAAMSMFQDRRVIRVDQAGEAVAEAVHLLLDAPVAGNPVVMTTGDLAKNSALRKLVEGHPAARFLYLYAMDARQARDWVLDKGRAHGLSFAPGIPERMAEAAGNDVGTLGQELAKYALYLDATPGSPKRVEAQTLAAIGTASADDDVYALVTAITVGDRAGVERQLALMPSGSAFVAMRAMARRLFQLLDARRAMDRGADAGSAIKSLRPPVFWKEADQIVPAMRQWPRNRIEAGLASLLAAEAGIKAPASPGEVLALHALVRLAAGHSGPARPTAGHPGSDRSTAGHRALGAPGLGA